MRNKDGGTAGSNAGQINAAAGAAVFPSNFLWERLKSSTFNV
jgi:hypothetical protein